jgi:hypothetical protein
MFQPTIGTSESSEDEDEYEEEVEEDEEDDEEIEYEEEDEEEEEEEDENENEIEEEDEDDDENQDYEYDEENENAEEEEIEEEDEEEEEPDEEEDEEDERQDEEEEEDEEEDENNEEQEEEDEDTVMARIIQRIETLPESEIGICKSDNEAFLHVMRKTNAIRKKCNPDEYVKLKQEMKSFATDEETIEAFTEFREICQFIMHIHKRYHVKLTEESVYSDSVLDIIRNILCKYPNRFLNIENITLTPSPQYTTM